MISEDEVLNVFFTSVIPSLSKMSGILKALKYFVEETEKKLSQWLNRAR